VENLLSFFRFSVALFTLLLLGAEKLCYPKSSGCDYGANNDASPFKFWGGF